MTLRPFPVDLFNEVPVTWPEVDRWCDNLPHISPQRRAWYIQRWNVIGKIQAAKLAGRFAVAIDE